MANLSITNVCNRHCVYCFANDTRQEYGQTHMDDTTFSLALDYLKRSGIKKARFLGGEPTLHPNFIPFVRKALEMDFDIMLFTNGLMNVKTLDYLATLPDKKTIILLNTIHPLEQDKQGEKIQRRTMEALGSKIIPGVNIYSAEQELTYLLDLVKRYNLKKEIRLGISHSVLSANNTYLHPKEYFRVGNAIVRLKRIAMEKGIDLGIDCGFVPCMFHPDHFDLLSEELKKAGKCCHPIIDLLTDGTFISCYPLNNFHKIKLDSVISARDVIQEFEHALSPYARVGIYPHCSSCPLFNKRCNGGCMAYRIQRFQPADV
jgi:radical SAM protein with 4Fe4S-binding SPASM domain